jgi:hypothetical protein
LMLASTVQFSRYGRPRDETRRIRSGPSRSRRETSRARSLRTQQRARPPPRRRQPSRPPPKRKAVLGRHCRAGNRITRRPQMSSHPRTLA